MLQFKHPNCKAYFLSHFHSDHYAGATKKWKKGLIYCSDVTAKMVNYKFGTSLDMLVPLPLNEEKFIDPQTGKLTDPSAQNKIGVTLIDANHCPGAVYFFLSLFL